MKISVENFTKAIDKWVNNDLLSKGSPFQKGLTCFLYLQGKGKIQDMLSKLSILADSEGNFNYTDLQNNIVESFDLMGAEFAIPVIGYNFDRNDLNKIFEYCKEYLVND